MENIGSRIEVFSLILSIILVALILISYQSIRMFSQTIIHDSTQDIGLLNTFGFGTGEILFVYGFEFIIVGVFSGILTMLLYPLICLLFGNIVSTGIQINVTLLVNLPLLVCLPFIGGIFYCIPALPSLLSVIKVDPIHAIRKLGN